MDCCAICLEVANDALPYIYIESNEWQKFNTQRIIEKHLWWWHLQQSSAKKSSHICRQCWEMLSSFHAFYMQVKKVHQQYDAEKWPVLKRSIIKDKCHKQGLNANTKIVGKGYKICAENINEYGNEIRNCSDDADIPNNTKSKSKSETLQFDVFLAESGYQLYCDLCNISLVCFTELKSHYRLKHNISGYALCCSKKFYNRKQFAEHLRAHENPNCFECSVCSRVLSNRSSYENHLKCHKPSTNRILACDECKMSFRKKDAYDRHILLHNENSGITTSSTNNFGNANLVPNNSQSADLLTVTNSVSRTDSENVNKKFYNNLVERNACTDIDGEVTNCDETLPNVGQNYFINILDNTEIKERFPAVITENITCSGNEQIFPENYADIHSESSFNPNQNEHIIVPENTETNDISCVIKSENVVCSENGEIFNYSFIEECSNYSNNETLGCDTSRNKIYQKDLELNTFNELKTNTYKNVRMYKIDEEYLKRTKYTVSCHLCMASFSNFYELKTHCRLEHNVNGYAMCCNRKMYYGGKFADHLRVHENPNYFKCTACSKILRHRTTYETHIQSHKRKKKEINCDICDKKFANKIVLYRHQNVTHTREMQKEQICSFCSKVSSNMQAHRDHIRYNHTKGLRHACHFCEKKFNRPFHLKEHLSIHTGVPLYACPHCSRPFKSKANFHTHRKKVHPKEWEEDRIKKLAAEKFKKLSLDKKRK